MVRNSPCFRVSAYTLLIVAWIFSVSIIADCTFLRIGLSATEYSQLAEFGIFEINLDAPDGHRCARYASATPISAGFKAARAFGVMNCMALGIAMIQVICLQCFTDYKRSCMWLSVRVEIIIGFVCQLLTFSAFAEESCGFPDTKCVPGAAGVLAIFNVVLLMFLVWMFWVLPSPQRPMFEIRRRAPPPPSNAPPTLEEQEKELNQSIEVSMEDSQSGMASSGRYRGPADEAEAVPPAAPTRHNNSFNDRIEDPSVPLDRIDEESF